MIQEVKNYKCDSTPNEQDIQQAISISESTGCLINLYWIKSYSDKYSVIVSPDSTVESIKEKMPKYYCI